MFLFLSYTAVNSLTFFIKGRLITTDGKVVALYSDSTTATETARGKIPLNWLEWGESLADHMVTDLEIEMTAYGMISMVVNGRIQDAELTSKKDMKIHQGKKKCLNNLSKGPTSTSLEFGQIS